MPREANPGGSPLAEPLAVALAANQAAEAPVRRPGTAWAVLNAAAACLILLAVSPMLILVAVAVALDGGPAFFRQSRVGLAGAEFTMIKFRSMVVDAETRLPGLRAADDGTGPLFKMRNDPRVTRLGGYLRKYSLDELPQLLNVVGGTMSLVGPRPALPSEVDAYRRTARKRLAVKPGMTGLWQVSGRSDLSWKESIALDTRYAETWSPWLDLKIMARTVRVALEGRGAY
jgi:lipopolysaccharide/colanic/teichoic acid biosynthesis glycosyltransferase